LFAILLFLSLCLLHALFRAPPFALGNIRRANLAGSNVEKRQLSRRTQQLEVSQFSDRRYWRVHIELPPVCLRQPHDLPFPCSYAAGNDQNLRFDLRLTSVFPNPTHAYAESLRGFERPLRFVALVTRVLVALAVNDTSNSSVDNQAHAGPTRRGRGVQRCPLRAAARLPRLDDCVGFGVHRSDTMPVLDLTPGIQAVL
jgi:hypothetical protein